VIARKQASDRLAGEVAGYRKGAQVTALKRLSALEVSLPLTNWATRVAEMGWVVKKLSLKEGNCGVGLGPSGTTKRSGEVAPD
jgi:hypothetical protein